jgi:hypothetical protein
MCLIYPGFHVLIKQAKYKSGQLFPKEIKISNAKQKATVIALTTL